MEQEIKFTEDELSKLKSLQDRFSSLLLQFGQLKIEEMNLVDASNNLNSLRDKLESEYKSLIDNEKQLSGELSQKYGEGVLDPKTGVFTPNKA